MVAGWVHDELGLRRVTPSVVRPSLGIQKKFVHGARKRGAGGGGPTRLPSSRPADLTSQLKVPSMQRLREEVLMLGAGQTVKRQMVTYRITAFGKELAGFGQVGNALETLFPLATILCRSQSDGKSKDLDFPT